MPQKAKSTQATKAIQARKQPKQKKQSSSPRLVVAPLTRAVRANVPASLNRKQELVLPVYKTDRPDPSDATKKVSLLQQFVLHPNNIPWLNGIAPSFQKWGLQNLRIWYEPRVSSTTNGTISMAVLSDFKDVTPTSLQSLTSTKGAVRGAPWDKFTLSCPKYRTFDYVNDFGSLTQEDQNSRALGRIVVVADMDDSFPKEDMVGRIFIEYTPVLVDPIDPNLQTALAVVPSNP
uniref:Capsid protein n=1 Tax=Nanning Tombu tick virus 1 TaxID=2972341 RepID=A0A9E8A9Z7_9TOMB|nr:MAG: coat protein [Nanning Tombu tick virus 1]